MTAQAIEKRDYFTDLSVLRDPYEYFRAVAAQGPVYQMEQHDALIVTGFEEALEVFRNTSDFSSFATVAGSAYPLPFEPKGSDISEQLEKHWDDGVPGNELLVAWDGDRHTAIRSIVNQLLTPTQLKANEKFMHEYSNKLVSDAVARGGCEIVSEIATPFVTLVIADLLGVPPEDREKFREVLDQGPPAGNMEDPMDAGASQALEFMAKFFVEYIQDRRANPRDDVLTQLATATYPDGTLPELMDMVRLATFMFAAGQDTSAKLLANSMKYICEEPGLQQQLREDLSLIPALLEEVLRLEGSTKATFRVARRDTTIGDYKVPAGKRITLALAAANRDPRVWENPDEFRLKRPRIKQHLAFGRGIHTCAGNPLARAEVKVILEYFFNQTSHISLSEEKHGPPGNRNLEYEPSFIIRGLENLYVDLTPA